MSSNHPGPPDQPNGPSAQDRQAPHPVQAPPAPRPRTPVPVRQPGSFQRGFGLGAGAGTGFGVALLVLSTVASLLTGAIFVIGAVASAGAAVEPTTTVWGAPSAPKTLRAVDVKGAILTDADGGALLGAATYGYEVAKQIDELEAKDADGLILRMNTPGGTITGSKAVADAVDRYKQRTNKKVFAHVQGLSASGGMYAMAGADEIQADYGSSIGSIGVLSGPFSRYRDVVALEGGLLGGGVTTTGGIERQYLSQGRNKVYNDPFEGLPDEARAELTRGLENEYANFVDHVATKRNIPAEAIRDDLGALIFDTATAQEKKLIDGTMGVDEAYRHFATSAGLDPANTKVVAADRPSPWLALLGAEARVRGQALPVEAVPGVPPVTAASICGQATTVLAYHGSVERECG